MPYLLLAIGLLLTIAGARGRQDELFNLLKGDFAPSASGQPSFWAWLVAVIVLGALGYVDALKPISRAFLVLLIIVLVLKNGGFFAQFETTVLQQKGN